MINCPECNEQQWSMMDKEYLKLFGHCWSCDKKLWEEGKLSLEEFEKREREALRSQEEDEQTNNQEG